MYNGELVGYTADLSHLVVEVEGLPQRVRIPLTQDFADTVAELMVGRSQTEGQGGGVMATRLLRDPRVQERAALAADREASRLSPKVIQRRLRSGDSPEAVARAAGTSIAHILRWYQPIKAEQDQLIDIVRGAVQERASLGYSSLPIGDAVIDHLRDSGVDLETLRWTAAKPEGRDKWVVSVHYATPSGTASRVARWTCDPVSMVVEPRDEHARDLGWVDPGPGRGPAKPLSQREALGITPNPNHHLVARDPGEDKLVTSRTSPRGRTSPTVTTKREKYVPFQNYERAKPPSPRRPIGD